MTRFTILLLTALCAPISASADKALGLHDALMDCITAVQTPDNPKFPNATQANGDPFAGYVIWYDTADGQTIYGLRFATEDGVSICSGPPPMGPFLDDYDAHDKASVTQMMKDIGLRFISVPVDGDYYADCDAETPNYLLAVQADDTKRVGFKFIRSPNVPETCRKFGT